ncbi:Uu.00g067880.m01.CDS01 [Anthostomella pinea]|uniref:Uu.00g067880.m01.CDS01 n=1 Tax=Anthostomella pinea TaxID=933095 RepID=A0AAI8YNE0_9PEZI|nr:Uu.00g067880.m01.CDS01 [Anthostomella pinea]
MLNNHDYLQGSLADAVLIRISNTTIKVAFLVFNLRLFNPVTRARYMIWAGMAIVVTFGVVFVIVNLVACSPWPSEGGNWLAPSFLDRCNGISVDLITAAAYMNVITDFYILFIPLLQIPKLGLSLRRKIGISIIFSTGLLAAGAGSTNLIIRSNKKVFDRSDFTWTIVPVYITSIVELNVGLICHSMPVVSILFVGRFTNFSKSVSSWVRERRSPRHSPRHSAGESSPNLAPEDGDVTPQISPIMNDANLSGMRKFIRNLYRSGARSSARGDTTLGTFDDLTSADLSYHLQLKTMQSKRTEESRGGDHV